MSHGQLVAFGSSMRLKRRFGAGYSLRLVTPFASAPALRAQVQSLLPEATLVDDSAGSLTFAISEEAMKASAPLLRYIESLQATGSSNGGVGAAPARLAVGCAGLVSSMGARLGGGGSEASPRSQALASNGGVVLNDWLITHTTLEEVRRRTCPRLSMPAAALLPLAPPLASSALAARGFPRRPRFSSLRPARRFSSVWHAPRRPRTTRRPAGRKAAAAAASARTAAVAVAAAAAPRWIRPRPPRNSRLPPSTLPSM